MPNKTNDKKEMRFEKMKSIKNDECNTILTNNNWRRSTSANKMLEMPNFRTIYSKCEI